MMLIILSMSFVTASGPPTKKIYSHLLGKALQKKHNENPNKDL